MIRYASLQVAVLAALILIGTQETQAQNVLIDLTEDGTLTLVEEFAGGKNPPVTAVEIVTANDVVSLRINGEPGTLDFDPADIHAIDVTNVDWVSVFAFPQPLIADLTVHGASIVEIASIAGVGGICGNTTISSGLGSGVVSISDVQLFGDLSVSTGQALDVVQFGRPYVFLNSWGPVAVHGNLSVNTGQDGDELWLSDALYVGGDVEIQLGQGHDRFIGDQLLETDPDSNVSISLGQQ